MSGDGGTTATAGSLTGRVWFKCIPHLQPIVIVPLTRGANFPLPKVNTIG